MKTLELTPEDQLTRTALLGVCDRVGVVPNVAIGFAALNVLGLRFDLILSVYPGTVGPITLLFAFFDIKNKPPEKVVAEFDLDPERFNFSLDFGPSEQIEAPADHLELDVFRLPHSPSWTIIPVLFPAAYRTISQPGRLCFFDERNEKRVPIGEIRFLHAPPAPLTRERIAALRSDVNAAKYVRFDLVCRKCGDSFKSYAGIERSEESESEGYLWHGDAPPRFRCKCGEQDLDLQYLRGNLHAVLLDRSSPISAEGPLVTSGRLYEAGAIETILTRTRMLIARKHREEDLQKFIVENPVLLHRFAADRLIPKGPILNKHATDFVVLSKTGELFLIEIERANHKLLKKDGGRTAALNHAIDQVNDWLHVFDSHRQACLSSLGVEEDVTAVRGVAIIGRDLGHDAHYLKRLKATDLGRVVFYTYDDLIGSLESLAKEVRHL